MPERTIVITPTLSNAELQLIENWKAGADPKRVERAFLSTLNQLSAGRINWLEVMRMTEREASGFRSVNVGVAREAGAKIGAFSKAAGWNLYDPMPVLYIGYFGQEKIDQIASRLRNRHNSIVYGNSVFESEEYRNRAEQRAREALVVYDNQNSDPPGAKQIIDSAITTFIAENPDLNNGDLQQFIKRLLAVKEVSFFLNQPAKVRPLREALDSKKYDLATKALDGAR